MASPPLAKNVGAPISEQTAVAVLALLAALVLLPSLGGKGLRVRYATWNRAGLAVAILYSPQLSTPIASLSNASKNSLRCSSFQVESLGALPLPPSLWHWDGLVNTPHGVYEVRLDLSERPDLAAIEHRYYPDAIPNQYIDAAKRLPEVQKVLWFSRFPVTRFHKEGNAAVVEFFDARFSSIRRDRPTSFTVPRKNG